MKLLIQAVLILLISTSCASWHKKRIDHHTEKLLSKGVVIPKDTIEVKVSDTIIKSFTRNDTTFVEKVITNTITLEPIIEYKTKWQTKIEERTKVKIERIKGDTEVKIVKEHRKEKRSLWWLWFGLGIISTLGLLYLKKRLSSLYSIL